NTIDKHDTHTEWDYYDVNEVHTIRITKDEKRIDEGWSTERGEFRTHTVFKSKFWANVFKKDNEDEIEAKKGLTGIRFTTSSKYGNGNNNESHRKYIRSENIDDLLLVLGLAKASRDGSAKNIGKPVKDVGK